jgi:hypothetical protein
MDELRRKKAPKAYGVGKLVNKLPFVWIPRWNRDWSIKCEKCGKIAWHIHHITYNPSKITFLCVPCHDKITRLNASTAWNQYNKLSNEQRVELFEKFIEA